MPHSWHGRESSFAQPPCSWPEPRDSGAAAQRRSGHDRRRTVAIARLEDLTHGALVGGVVPDAHVTVVSIAWHGSEVVRLTYRTADGAVAEKLLFREDEPSLALVAEGRPWSFDGDGDAFRLASEAKRISLAYLFDPYVAVSTSLVEPLPHQITAVYADLLDRQPLSFLLADDPGAGKTIMTGLYIRELLVRGELRRCLIVAPGSLVEQWQQELAEKFHLGFTLLTNDLANGAASGNVFTDNDLLIARLDKLSRDEDLQLAIETAPDYDLIVFDEARKLSATLFADEVKATKRRKLAERIRNHTRNLLLLTATPHNGKEADFELFMSLLDPDRFAGHRRAASKAELDQEAKIDALPPVIAGGAIVVPQGLLDRLAGRPAPEVDLTARETRRVEALAMAAVIEDIPAQLTSSSPTRRRSVAAARCRAWR